MSLKLLAYKKRLYGVTDVKVPKVSQMAARKRDKRPVIQEDIFKANLKQIEKINNSMDPMERSQSMVVTETIMADVFKPNAKHRATITPLAATNKTN